MSERQEKQQYLRTEIVGKGYSTEKFIEYCQEVKGEDGGDIDIWDLAELKQAVNHFQSLNGADEEETKSSGSPSRSGTGSASVSASVTPTSSANVSRSQPLSLSKTYWDNYENVIMSRNTEVTELSKKTNAYVSITDPKTESGTTFSGKFVSYQVTTRPLSWSTRRRFNDFKWLRGVLATMYPTAMIPPLPDAKTSGRFEQEFIMSRLSLLEKFINAVLRNDLLRSCKFVEGFLRSETLQSLKSEGDKAKKPKIIEEMVCRNGEAPVSTDETSTELTGEMMRYLEQIEMAYLKAKKIAKVVVAESQTLANNMILLRDALDEIHDVQKTAPEEVGVKDMSAVFDESRAMTDKWAAQLLDHATIMQNYLLDFMRYNGHEVDSTRDTIKSQKSVEQDFGRKTERLREKKEKMWKVGDISKWELDPRNNYDRDELLQDKEKSFTLMSYKDTAELERVKNLHGFYTWGTIHEFRRLQDENTELYKAHFEEFGAKMINLLTQSQLMWADFTTRVGEMKEASSHPQLETSNILSRSIEQAKQNVAEKKKQADDHSQPAKKKTTGKKILGIFGKGK